MAKETQTIAVIESSSVENREDLLSIVRELKTVLQEAIATLHLSEVKEYGEM